MTIIMKETALVASLRAEVLSWYDKNRRDLVWRRGARDAYRVWLAEVMLQQTTVQHATPYFERFLELWPTIQDLAKADEGEVMAAWAGLGYYARARRLLACAKTVARDFEGVFPADEVKLRALPGFGPYTAAAVAAIAYDRPANVVDGNIERIMARLYAIDLPMPKGRGEVYAAAHQWVQKSRAGDWPQALMDLASQLCRPRRLGCDTCPLKTACLAFLNHDPEHFPVKGTKVDKPRRFGSVFVMRLGDQVIVERRPDQGLLGGMLGLPHSVWGADPVPSSPAFPEINLAFTLAGQYDHVFTHFKLTQTVWIAEISAETAQDYLRHNNSSQLLPMSERALPTVFAKALKFLS